MRMKMYRPSMMLGYNITNPPLLYCSDDSRRVGYNKLTTGYNNPKESAKMRFSQAIRANNCVSAGIAAGNSNEDTSTV